MENFLINYMLPIFGSFVSFLLLMLTRKLLMWMQVKLNVEMSDKFHRDLESVVKEAVWSAEEMAASNIKQGLPQWTSGMKFRWAIDMVGKRFPELSKEEAESKINSMLGRSVGLGASPDKGEQCISQSQPVSITMSEQCEKELAKPF